MNNKSNQNQAVANSNNDTNGKKRQGRPKGSKNKPKTVEQNTDTTQATTQVIQSSDNKKASRQGRPKGSKNKPKIVSADNTQQTASKNVKSGKQRGRKNKSLVSNPVKEQKMTVSQVKINEEDAKACLNMLRSLQHPIRQAIIAFTTNDDLTVNDICDKLKIEQSVASQHLKHMREDALVTSEKIGRHVIYTANTEFINRIKPMFADMAIIFKQEIADVNLRMKEKEKENASRVDTPVSSNDKYKQYKSQRKEQGEIMELLQEKLSSSNVSQKDLKELSKTLYNQLRERTNVEDNVAAEA